MEDKTPKAFVELDFKNVFPHKNWISSWAKDEHYPDGFRYKLFAVRIVDEDKYEMILILEKANGDKEEMSRFKISPTALGGTCKIFTEGLIKEHGIDLEVQDMSDVKTLEEYDKRVKSYGWKETQAN